MMLLERQTKETYRDDILRDVQERAVLGVRLPDLVTMIQDRLDVPHEITVPALGYLCRAFRIPLSVMLHIRDRHQDGPFVSVLQSAIWFSATVLKHLERARVWNWGIVGEQFGKNHFNHEQIRRVVNEDDGYVEIWETNAGSGLRYVRACLETRIDRS